LREQTKDVRKRKEESFQGELWRRFRKQGRGRRQILAWYCRPLWRRVLSRIFAALFDSLLARHVRVKGRMSPFCVLSICSLPKYKQVPLYFGWSTKDAGQDPISCIHQEYCNVEEDAYRRKGWEKGTFFLAHEHVEFPS